MGRGRQLAPLSVTSEEREALERWARRPKTGQALAQRARIILESAIGKSNTEVARCLRITKQMVGKWRTRFLEKRHLILDNYGTHKTASIQRWLLKRPRFQLHFTPTELLGLISSNVSLPS